MTPHLNDSLYNPGAENPQRLLAKFIDRKGLLTRILDIIRHNRPDMPQQHLVLIGPRGMGKTTLLCVIRHSLERDAELADQWLPIAFFEEQYGIGDLADFWLEALRHLEAALNLPQRAAAALLDKGSDDLADQAQQRFYAILQTSGKRALLLVDNLNDIFTAIDDGHALHQLRALWMTDPRMMVIGSAPGYFAEITEVDQVFHDFFRTFNLERLSQQEMEAMLRKLAEVEQQNDAKLQRADDAVWKVSESPPPAYNDGIAKKSAVSNTPYARLIQVIEQAPERVAALRILTGGNPRLVKLGYRVLCDGLNGDVRHDLERLLDESTPFFKHRIESLAKEARRAFDAIARRWDPVTVDDIRKELRKPSNYISAQIKRLIDEGFVEEAGGDKKKRYQVSERFYNVYYLMRHSREGRKRLRWLAGFMQTFYSRSDFRDWARRLDKELAGPLTEAQRMDKLAYLQALSEAADEGGCSAAFEALVRDAIARDDRCALDEAAAEPDAVEIYGVRYLLAEVLWLLDGETRRRLGFQPSYSDWCRKLGRILTQAGLLETAEQRIESLSGWRMDSARHTRAAAGVHEYLFGRVEVAEKAYRQALVINPQCIYAWNSLGNLLSDQGKVAEAEAAYHQALDIDPQYATAWNNLGLLLANQGKAIEAETAYRQALTIDAQYVLAWNNLGSVLADQGKTTETETAYRQALTIDAQYAYAHINLGRLYLLDMQRPTEGAQALLQGLSLEPESDYGRHVFRKSWSTVLPHAAARLIAEEADKAGLRGAVLDVLLAVAQSEQRPQLLQVLLNLEEAEQAPFEPLILALQALNDRAVLYRIAREKRDLVLDVMARLEEGKNSA